ncbi:hypothetical protein HYDPIDRAFT_186397 [Hydnomerulius pinastri MD-312]|nr:hypothetical protein HYDPIDRAFT_186397 [Hydnomerulius pinastri MD-312]
MPSTTISKKSSKDSKPAKNVKRDSQPLSKTKPAEPEPEPRDGSEASEAEGSGSEGDDYLHGFSTDDDDSSDDEVIVEDGIDVGKLPTIAKDDATVQKKLERAKRQPKQDRGVISISRLPHGFYEDQLKAYFSQFGEVSRLRVSRNKKTGKSKHYAFLEFESTSVAEIVAETMDNYLLMGHILKCKVIPKDEVHPELWVGANRKWKAVPRDRVARVQHNKPRTEESIQKAEKRLMKRQKERKRKLEEAGIKYDFDAAAYH